MNTAGSKRPRESDAPIPLDTADVAIGGEPAVNDAESTAVPSSSASRKKAKTDGFGVTASADGGDVAGMNGGSAVDDTPSTFPTSVDVEKSTTMDTAAESSAAAAKPAPRRAQRKSALAAKNKIIAAEATVDETDEDMFVKKKVDNNNAAPSSSTAEQQAVAGTAALATNAKAAASASTAISTKLVPPPVVQRSRGRGGDRIPEGQTPPTVSASAAAALAALHPQDPNNPYMLPYPHMSMMHPAMIPPNPYLPPPPPGSYPMFSPGMMPGPGGYPMIPPGFQIPGQQAQQQPGQEGANASGDSGNGNGGEQPKEGEQKENGASGSAGEGGATGEGQSSETNANNGDQSKNTNGDAAAGTNSAAQPQPQPPHHPYAYVYPPPGFAGHVMPAPEYLPNPNDPNAPQHHHHVGVHPHHHPHPLPHMQMIPPMTHHAVPNPTGTHHPPHPALHQTHHHPGMASTMQLTLPLAVTDSALPSHLDALIRAPDSLTVTYTEVPDGAYLLRSDFGEPYPKQLEPPRKVTEIRCLFCKRHYSGPNARGMWRRHVTGKHDFAFERKPGGGGGGSGHGGSRVGGRSAPIVMDEDDDEGGGGGGDGGASGADVGNTTMNNGEGPDGQGGMGGMNLEGIMGMGGLMSMNGLPVPGASTGQPQQQPGGHNPAMHFGPVPILHPPLGSIPPHPHSGLDNSNKKRSGGVGAGNGGGGVVPRVHPLLTKEERIERARASKRHYAMKRRALEKMKQGGIPKGARLENGVFILTDGTQIPADPSVEYKDLSVKPGGGLSAVHGGTVGGDDDDEDDEFGSGSGVKGKGKKKGRGRASRTSKKEIADDDDEGDEDDDDGHIGDESGVLGDVNMDHPGDGDTSMSMGDLALMGHHGLVQMDGGQMNMIAGGGPGISVDMDPWGDPNAAAAMYQQHQHQEQVGAAAAAASVGLQGKLAEIPIVNRGSYKLSPVPQSAQDANANADPNEGFTAPTSEDLTATAPPVAAATKPAPRRGGRRSAATAAPVDDEEHDDGNAETSRAGLRRVGLRTRGEKKDIAPVFPPDNTSTVVSAVTSATVGGSTSAALPPGIIPPGEDEPERTFCYCNDVEYGNMIGCDNGPNCSREWFHLACTDITGPIPTRWFCRDCRLKIAEQDGPAPADASMETGESSVPSAVVAPSQEAAPAQEEGGRPRRRTTRISKATAPSVIEAPAIKAPAKKTAAPGGKKRGRKSKAGAEKPAAGEDEIDELADDGPIDDIGGAPAAEGQVGANDVESEDEQPAVVVASGSAPAAAHETPVGKPISSAKAAESPRSRRSTRGHPQVEA